MDDARLSLADDLRAAWIITRSVFRSKLSQPWIFALNVGVNSLDVVTPALAFAVLTHTFGTLGGWNLTEVMLLLGVTNACLGISLLLIGAFDSFLFVPVYRSGQFESALMRPGRPELFVAASNVRPYRLGRVIASFVLIVGAIVALEAERWGILAVLPLSLVTGSIMLSALWMIDASATIRLGQANDMTRNIPFIACEMNFFPQGLYPLTARIVAQFVFGVGSAIYLPLAYTLDKGPHFGIWSLLVPLFVLPWIVLTSKMIWKRSLRRYVTGDT